MVAACSVAAIVAVYYVSHEPRVETRAATAAPAVSKPALDAPKQGALAAAQAEANAVTATLGGPPPPDSVPSFDIARIEPTGEAVIAGRATPGAAVELLRDGEVHDRVVADQSGQFVMVPPRLPSGTYDLTLRARDPDGKQTSSKQSVTVALEPKSTDRPVVALMAPDKPTVVLSQPAPPKPMAGAVVAETVETEPGGKLHVSGRARPGAAMKLYLNDSFIASATAGADGRFAVTIKEGVASGNYRVRLDEMEQNSGAVRARAEVPFNVPDTMVTASVPAGHRDQTAGRCRRTAAGAGGRHGRRSARQGFAARQGLTLHRGRAEDQHHHRLTRRQPLAHQPTLLRSRHALRRHLQGEPGTDPKSQPDLSRPGFCRSGA